MKVSYDYNTLDNITTNKDISELEVLSNVYERNLAARDKNIPIEVMPSAEELDWLDEMKTDFPEMSSNIKLTGIDREMLEKSSSVMAVIASLSDKKVTNVAANSMLHTVLPDSPDPILFDRTAPLIAIPLRICGIEQDGHSVQFKVHLMVDTGAQVCAFNRNTFQLHKAKFQWRTLPDSMRGSIALNQEAPSNEAILILVKFSKLTTPMWIPFELVEMQKYNYVPQGADGAVHGILGMNVMRPLLGFTNTHSLPNMDVVQFDLLRVRYLFNRSTNESLIEDNIVSLRLDPKIIVSNMTPGGGVVGGGPNSSFDFHPLGAANVLVDAANIAFDRASMMNLIHEVGRLRPPSSKVTLRRSIMAAQVLLQERVPPHSHFARAVKQNGLTAVPSTLLQSASVGATVDDPTVFPSDEEIRKMIAEIDDPAITKEEREELFLIIKKYRERFHVSGKLPAVEGFEFDSDFTGSSWKVPRPYPLKPEQLEIMNQQCEDEVKQGLLIEVTDPSLLKTVSPCFFKVEHSRFGIKKYRRLVDYTKLNSGGTSIKYALPNMETLKVELSGARWLIGLDLKSAYAQVKIAKDKQKDYIFCIPAGEHGKSVRYFQPTRLTLGPTNAPMFFQFLADSVFDPVADTKAYIDDVTIAVRSSFAVGLKQLTQVLINAEKHNLTFSWAKTELFKKEKKTLGWLISEEGVKPDPGRVEELLNWEFPTTALLMQGFTGFYNYLARSFPQASNQYLQMLTAATAAAGERGKIVCTPELKFAFNKCKAMGAAWIVLAPLNLSRPVIIQTDSSNFAMGWIVLQYDPLRKCRRIVAMGSRKWSSAAGNYPAHELEGAALMAEVRRKRPFLRYSNLVLETDSEAAAYLLTVAAWESLPAKWRRYRMELADFLSVEVRYVQSKGVVVFIQIFLIMINHYWKRQFKMPKF